MEIDKEALESIGRALRVIGEALAKHELIGVDLASIMLAVHRIGEATGAKDLLPPKDQDDIPSPKSKSKPRDPEVPQSE